MDKIMKLTKLETLERISSDCNFQNDMRELIGTAFKCKLSAINLMVAYCDANDFTYSSEFSSYCLNCYHNLEW